MNDARRLSVIMFTDIVGYSRMMGADEAGAIALLAEHNGILNKAIAAAGGTTIKTIGDAYLVEFGSVSSAVECAAAIQRELAARNTGVTAGRQIHLRIGIHAGDVYRKDGDIFGDGVNVASRLQSIAKPDSVVVSGNLFSMLRGKTEIPFRALGRQKLKNITESVFAYEVLWDPARSKEASLRAPMRISRSVAVMAAVLLVLAVGGGVALYVRSKAAHKRPTFNIVSFQDRTGDARIKSLDMGGVVADALIHEMHNWPRIQMVSPLRLRSVLRRQKIAEAEVIRDPVVAAAITRKLDGQLLLMGDISKTPEGFVVKARLYDLADDRLLDEYVSQQKDGKTILNNFVHLLAARMRSRIRAHFRLPDDQEQVFAGSPAFSTKSPEAYAAFVRAFRELQFGNMQVAIRKFHEAVEIDPSFALAYSELACAYSWAKDEANAQLWAQKSLRFRDRFQGSSKDALLFQGNVAWGEGRHADAARRYQLMIDLYPDDRDGYLYAGTHAYYAQKDARKAAALLRDGIRLSPEYYTGYRDLAYAMRSMGRKKDAVELLLGFLRNYPESPGADIIRRQIVEIRTGSG